MSRTITNQTWEQMKTAYASGIGLRELARNAGVPEGTLLSRAKRERSTQKIQSAKALVKREDALAANPSEAAAMTLQERAERHLQRMAGISKRGVDHVETMDGPEILKSVDRIDKLDKIGRRTFGLDDAETQAHNTLVNVNILNM
jgi:hypothetical protein